jgi:hypothetical protein
MTPYEDDDELTDDGYESYMVCGATPPPRPLPMLRVNGEGYITRKDGEVVPFKIEGEAKWH